MVRWEFLLESAKEIESLEDDNALLKAKVKELGSALKEIYSINWGHDGDCGAIRIIDNVLD